MIASLVPTGAAAVALEKDGAVVGGGAVLGTTKRRTRTVNQHGFPFRFFLLVLGLSCCTTTVDGKQHRQVVSFQSRPQETQTTTAEEPTTYLQWQEDEEDESDEPIRKNHHHQQQEDTLPTSQKTQRRLFWTGRMEDQSYQPGKRESVTSSGSSPHPLRMKEWNVAFSWKEQRRQRATTMKFEFDANGYVRCWHPNTKQDGTTSSDQSSTGRRTNQQQQHKDEADQTNNFIVGTWKLAPSGMTWKMTWDGRSYSFYADLQVNPFGQYPKMFRGLVIRDRTHKAGVRRLLRPIVATFSGRGVGIDTADLTYKRRGPPKQ